MKWFTATNERSLYNDQFFWQLVVAIKSANLKTSLEPFLIFDGNECPRLAELRALGVQVIPHELSFKGQLKEYVLVNHDEEMFTARSGAYLRSEIPVVLKNIGIEDEFLLYTDADVLFMRDFDLSRHRPPYFSAVGGKMGARTRLRVGGWTHFNSGVMLMNVEAMRREHPRFVEFVLNNGFDTKRPPDTFMQKNLFLSDQVALNLYYKGKIDRLDKFLNWHPSQGRDDRACIVHFNGLKWTQWEEFLRGEFNAYRQAKFTKLVERNRAGYEHYVNLALKCLNGAASNSGP